MSAPTPAVAALSRAGLAFELHTYDHRGGAISGIEAAERLGLDLARVYKTLVVDAGTGARDIHSSAAIAVVPVAERLDLRAAARAIGAKRVEMVPAEVAERLSRSAVGAISPVGFARALPTVLDATIEGHPTVFVSAGRRGLELELAPEVLVRATGGIVAAICA
ncbi:MAG TPA: aminoacyl-tRNA deacylase [Microthrixaceae bacterium]|nr:aminoacyl-tRNA deacylase [Microthrixaceae bacterium]